MARPEGPPGESGRGRDGSGPQAAIPVGSVAEEYEWVRTHLPGHQFAGQALLHVEGRPFDVLTLVTADGEERRVYFDISSFYGLRRPRPPAAPCPYCGAPLRTSKANQCFACGMDWRDPAHVVRRGRA